MSGRNDLPDGWNFTTVGAISENIQYGYTESAKDEPVGPKFLRISDIQENGVDWETTPYCDISDAEKQKYLLKEGDILFARTGGTVGKSFLIQGDIPEAVFASYLIRIQLSENINERYVYYFFQSHSYWKQISEGKKGIGQPNVNSTILSEIQLPLPPISDQNRIVSKIEELFSKLESGVAELQKTESQLERYRRSILNKAVKGMLTEKWRNENDLTENVSLNENIAITKEHEIEGSLNAIPNNWRWVHLGKITENFDSEREPISKSERAEMQGKYPYYGASGIIDHLNDYILDGRFLLISEDGANLENRTKPIAFIVNGKFWPNNHAHVVQTKRGIPLDYLELYIESRSVKDYLSGTAQPKLTQTNLNKIPVPIGPPKELKRIVKLVKRKLSVINSTTNEVGDNLKRANRLKKSILEKAFDGELVPKMNNNNGARDNPESEVYDLENGVQKTLPGVTQDAE